MSMYSVWVERTAARDEFTDCSIRWSIAVHPAPTTGKILILYPGVGGHIDGYNGKYQEIAMMMVRRSLCAVIRSGNNPCTGFEYEETVRDNLRFLIEYALDPDHSMEICGATSPEIYLMGVSAGGSAVAAVADGYRAVKKILLIAPSADAGIDAMERSLKKYQGEVYITSGENDGVIPIEEMNNLYQLADNASRREFVPIPNCDHHWKGLTNGKILSKAPLWAFAGDDTYPSPDGGIILYK